MKAIAECFFRRGFPVGSVPFADVALRPVEGAKTVLITALPYYFPRQPGQNLARFAALPDYHRYFGDILREISDDLHQLYPEHRFLPYTDNSPVDEQKAALKSGIATKGKNNLCITDHGTFVFLGEILTDAEISLSASPPARTCNGCGNCVRACPNGALTEDGFHYEKCLAYLTQKKGDLTPEEAEAIRKNGMAWGCDRCSEACPQNEGLPRAPISLPPNELMLSIALSDLEGLSDRTYREKYRDRAFAWRGKATMLRNLQLLEKKEESNHG